MSWKQKLSKFVTFTDRKSKIGRSRGGNLRTTKQHSGVKGLLENLLFFAIALFSNKAKKDGVLDNNTNQPSLAVGPWKESDNNSANAFRPKKLWPTNNDVERCLDSLSKSKGTFSNLHVHRRRQHLHHITHLIYFVWRRSWAVTVNASRLVDAGWSGRRLVRSFTFDQQRWRIVQCGGSANGKWTMGCSSMEEGSQGICHWHVFRPLLNLCSWGYASLRRGDE